MSLEECDLPGAIRRADTDMTTGSIMRHLIAFSVPLLIGNIFQQLYNTVDSVVVGNFVGKQALAAVGSVAPIINMLIGFFTGFATGAGVLISRYFGAHERENVHKAVQTTIALTIILSVALSVVGVWMTPLMLRAMQTPDDVIVQAEEYLRIYFAGLSACCFITAAPVFYARWVIRKGRFTFWWCLRLSTRCSISCLLRCSGWELPVLRLQR